MLKIISPSLIKRSLQLNALEIYGIVVQRRRFIRAGTLLEGYMKSTSPCSPLEADMKSTSPYLLLEEYMTPSNLQQDIT